MFWNKWFQKKKQKKKNKKTKARHRNAKWVWNYKLTCKCLRCPESHPACLEFHHVGNKSMSIGGAVRRGWSIKRIQKEISKCIVLCANCHRKEHYIGGITYE